MKLQYSSEDGLFHVFMNTQRERMHKSGLLIRLGRIVETWGYLKIVSCEYESKDENRILTHLTCPPVEEFRDIMKYVCIEDESARGY